MDKYHIYGTLLFMSASLHAIESDIYSNKTGCPELAATDNLCANWKSQQHALGRLGSTWLRSNPVSAADYAYQFGNDNDPTKYSLAERYDNLSDLVYADFCIYTGLNTRLIEPRGSSSTSRDIAIEQRFVHSIAEGKEWEILSGVNVMGTMLSYAPAAYKAIRDIPQTPSERARQLGDILMTRQSFDNTAGFMADLEHSTSQSWEISLGLKPNQRLEPEKYPFVIKEAAEETVFIMNQSLIGDLEARTGRGCPAKNVLLRNLWSHLVKICVESEFLFPLDLAYQT